MMRTNRTFEKQNYNKKNSHTKHGSTPDSCLQHNNSSQKRTVSFVNVSPLKVRRAKLIGHRHTTISPPPSRLGLFLWKSQSSMHTHLQLSFCLFLQIDAEKLWRVPCWASMKTVARTAKNKSSSSTTAVPQFVLRCGWINDLEIK